MVRLQLYRSLWGIGQLNALNRHRVLKTVREQGFEGLEGSLTDIGGSTAERADFCAAARDDGLKLILSAYSSWTNYEGPYELLTAAAHVERRGRYVQQPSSRHF